MAPILANLDLEKDVANFLNTVATVVVKSPFL